MDSLEEGIRELFNNRRVVKVLHRGLLKRGSNEEVNKVLNKLESEGKIKRELRFKCGEECHITFNSNNYALGEEVECVYGHDTVLDETTETILYWVRV